MPTVAFNFRKVRKGNIVLKIWDVAGANILRRPLCPVTYTKVSGCTGQPRFRSMWERYCSGVDAIVYDDNTPLCFGPVFDVRLLKLRGRFE